MTCSLASLPEQCLALYRLRTSRLVHSWESVPGCSGCAYLKINGELAPRPVEDSPLPRGSYGPRLTDAEKYPVRVCVECGGEIGPRNKSGICRACSRALYGYLGRRKESA